MSRLYSQKFHDEEAEIRQLLTKVTDIPPNTFSQIIGNEEESSHPCASGYNKDNDTVIIPKEKTSVLECDTPNKMYGPTWLKPYISKYPTDTQMAEILSLLGKVCLNIKINLKERDIALSIKSLLETIPPSLTKITTWNLCKTWYYSPTLIFDIVSNMEQLYRYNIAEDSKRMLENIEEVHTYTNMLVRQMNQESATRIAESQKLIANYNNLSKTYSNLQVKIDHLNSLMESNKI